MSAKGGKAFFEACGQRDVANGVRTDKGCHIDGLWPHWAKCAYFNAYQSASIAKYQTPTHPPR